MAPSTTGRAAVLHPAGTPHTRLHPGITQEVAPNESQRDPNAAASEELIYEALFVARWFPDPTRAGRNWSNGVEEWRVLWSVHRAQGAPTECRQIGDQYPQIKTGEAHRAPPPLSLNRFSAAV